MPKFECSLPHTTLVCSVCYFWSKWYWMNQLIHKLILSKIQNKPTNVNSPESAPNSQKFLSHALLSQEGNWYNSWISRKFLSKTKLKYSQLDGVGPVDNRPSTKKKEEEKKDMCHVTQDLWHMTCDAWHMTDGVMWTFSQNLSSLSLTVWEWRCSEDLEEKGDSLNKLISFWQSCLENSNG